MGSVGVTPAPCGLAPQAMPGREGRMGMEEKPWSLLPKSGEPQTCLRSRLAAKLTL